MKKLLVLLAAFGLVLVAHTTHAGVPGVIDVTVYSNVTPSSTPGYFDYAYTLRYGPGTTRGISHWWLEINCAHDSILRDSIYGYTILNDVQYDWGIAFEYGNAQTNNYTDWVIKWNTPSFPNNYEIPKTEGTLIGYFGFISSQDYTTGNFGVKGGNAPFDLGTTQVPESLNCGSNIPEPTSMLLLGLGIFGFGVARKRVR